MLEAPATTAQITSADGLQLAGNAAETAEGVLQRWFELRREALAADFGIDELDALGLQIVLDSHAPRHCGWGSGTQLALALVAAIERHLGWPLGTPIEMAICSGRGKRSAIGTYGFFRGGFLIDRGKRAHQRLASLELRQAYPRQWPIVTWQPHRESGLAGPQEIRAFSNLPPTPAADRERAVLRVRDQLVPALLAGDFDVVAEGVFELGQHSGRQFSSSQGGLYASPAAQEWVQRVRDQGWAGVGQSSWGPTLFALTSSQASAEELVAWLEDHPQPPQAIQIHVACNAGATIESAVAGRELQDPGPIH